MSQLIGSPKQVAYALQIIKKTQKRFPNRDLRAINSSSVWWIANEKNLNEILSEQSNSQVVTPFTYTFPRYSKSDAIQALNQLDDFLVLDCESNGVGKHAECTELAIVDFKTDEVLFNSLIRPYRLSEEYETSKAKEVSGISREELLHAPVLPEVWPDILAILQSKHLTSFNVQFDIPLIRGSAQIWDIEVPPIPATCLMKITTAFLARDFYASLDEAMSYFCVDNSSRHRALGDTLATCEIVRAMKRIIESEK